METNNAKPNAPTPETQAFYTSYRGPLEWADFARKLERDRDRLVALIGQMRQAVLQQDWDEFNLLIEAAYEKP